MQESCRKPPVHLLHSRITAKSLLICHYRHSPAATVTSRVPEEVINAWKAPWSPREQQAACIMEQRFLQTQAVMMRREVLGRAHYADKGDLSRGGGAEGGGGGH